MSSDSELIVDEVNVDLGDRSYPIYIGTDILSDRTLLLPYIKGAQVCIISNETVSPLYLQQVIGGLSDSGLEIISLILPDGEEFKTLDTVTTIYDHLLEANFSRSSTLLWEVKPV
ncbi:MAG: hypothetical protein ACKVKR_01380 [Pseudomonadales bacterium]